MPTKIEWVRGAGGTPGETYNPIGGCRKISPGCQNCYAIRQAHRMAGNPNAKIAARYAGLTQIEGGRPNWTGATSIDEDALMAPLRRRKPTTYFISLSDLFYEARPNKDIDRVFAVMALAHWHTFQVLTKYTGRMKDYFAEDLMGRGARNRIYNRQYGLSAIHQLPVSVTWPLPNLWLGVSVENREQLRRVDVLRRAPAALRFLSLEPLLEDLGEVDLTSIDWVIAGGESGPGARPCRVEWIRSIVQQCGKAGVPCFVKQLGARPERYMGIDAALELQRFAGTDPDQTYHIALVDKKGGNPDEWPADLRVRQYPEARR